MNGVSFMQKACVKSKYLFRGIEALQLATTEPICFITNIENLIAAEIIEIY